MKNKLLPLLLLLGTISITAQETIIGFSDKASETQEQLEANYEKQLSSDNLDQWMKRMAAEPHWVGTEYGEENVKWMEKQYLKPP